MGPLSFVIFALSLIFLLITLELVMQIIFSNIPVYYSIYTKEFIDFAFWLIPAVCLVVLVFAFIFKVFPFRPRGRDYYMEEDG